MAEGEDEALFCIERPEIYNHDFRRRRRFHGSVWEMGIHSWRKKVTLDTMLQRADYSALAETVCQHPG